MTSTLESTFITSYFEQVTQLMKKDGEVQGRSKAFQKLKTNTERVSYVLELEAVKKVVAVPDYKNISCKSSELAIKYRGIGNEKFQNKDYDSALLFYHKSVIVAPAGSNSNEESSTNSDLTLAYANRSAAYFHLKKYQACLLDINRAFSIKYPQELQYKLYDRQARCFIHLKQYTAANTAFKNAKNALPLSRLDAKKCAFWEKEFAKGLSSCKQLNISESFSESDRTAKLAPDLSECHNDTFVSLNATCEVSYTKDEGRYISCKEEILPGDVVMVEKPFASVLLPERYNSHCHHCYANLVTPVACSSCPLAVFCSDECKVKATNSYHRYECSILQAVHKSGVGKFGHLALRAVTVKSAAFFKKHKEAISGDYRLCDMRLRGCSTENQYTSQDYSTIYNLVGHSELRTSDDLFMRTISAVFLLKCLQQTSFFDQKDEDFITFIGGLFLAHLQSFPCNAHEISELVLDETQVATSTCQEIGAGIYATLSLFNHSCDPAVTRHFYGDTCVVRAIRPIMKGEQVSDNYGALYAVHGKSERQSILNQYYFECQCVACRNDWPLYMDIRSDYPLWLCTHCRQPLTSSHTESNTQAVKCEACNGENDLTKKGQSIQEATEKYYKGLNSLMECNISSAMVELSKALAMLYQHVKLPWREVNNSQEAIKQCFNTLGNCNIVKRRLKIM